MCGAIEGACWTALMGNFRFEAGHELGKGLKDMRRSLSGIRNVAGSGGTSLLLAQRLWSLGIATRSFRILGPNCRSA
jgi:hypothetical protein